MQTQPAAAKTKRRIVEDLKLRNQDHMNLIAGEYFGSKFTYAQTFQMFEVYKKAFLMLDGLEPSPVIICAPATIASVNAMFGAMDANKIVSMTGPGFLYSYTERYTSKINCKTVFIYDGFLNEEFIRRLHDAGVKNVVLMSVTDYMNPLVKLIGGLKGLVPKKEFLKTYTKDHTLPKDMKFMNISDFVKLGEQCKQSFDFPYEEKKIGAYFLTGATTSALPKDVQLYADGFTRMASIYDQIGFGFRPGTRETIFIPLFYATGAVHGVYAGLFSGATLIYKPKYDRFAFAGDLIESKCEACLVAPSHVATLEDAGLPDNALSYLEYIFIGGEAIMPAQMLKFRQTAKRLGIQHIINGYGMTETGSLSGLSDITPDSDDDVSVIPVPGVQYRVVDPDTREPVPDGTCGVLEVLSPCATAGYLDEEKNGTLFTSDGWIHTGDIAMRLPNGKYRVFGRATDSFKNKGKTYAMYAIEEKVLEHPAVAEAEVVKYELNGEEYPAIFIVLNAPYRERAYDVLKEISALEVDGMQYLLGVKFIDKFYTNSVTSKRDSLALAKDMAGFFKVEEDKVFQVDIGTHTNPCEPQDVAIIKNE